MVNLGLLSPRNRRCFARQPMNRLLLVALCLAFLGGYADAAGFLLTRTFTGHVTGNTVFLAINLAQANWRLVATNAMAVGAFLLGTGSAEWVKETTETPKIGRRLRMSLMIEGMLLTAAAGCHYESRWWCDMPSVVCLCLALGIQNGALRKCGAMSVHTTFITGLSTTVLSDAVRRAAGHGNSSDHQNHPSAVLAGILAAFTAGAGAGGYLSLHFEPWTLPGLLVPCGIALIVARSDNGTEKSQ